jgi:hypothetical protein
MEKPARRALRLCWPPALARGGELFRSASLFAVLHATFHAILVIGCRQPCAISDINDPKVKSLFGVVVVATEKVGGAFNRASPLTQKLIGFGLTALGGVKGVVEEVVLSVAPQAVQDAIGKAGEAITVGADALLRSESFGTIAAQNENKTPANPTFNQTTGIGLATSIVAIGGGIKAVKGKGGGSGDRLDTPPPPRDFLSPDDFAKLPATGTIDPKTVRFSQDSISADFKNGAGSVDSLIADLKSGKVDPTSIPPIRIVEKDGQIFSLDNRRLHAFQEAGIDIPFVKLDRVPRKERKKFSTENRGESILKKNGN